VKISKINRDGKSYTGSTNGVVCGSRINRHTNGYDAMGGGEAADVNSPGYRFESSVSLERAQIKNCDRNASVKFASIVFKWFIVEGDIFDDIKVQCFETSFA
jgi:hypothetical protein